jgi:hypothetical protein
MSNTILLSAALASCAASVYFLKRATVSRSGAWRWVLAALVTASLALFAAIEALGTGFGLVVAVLTLILAGLSTVFAGAERRTGRKPDTVIEPRAMEREDRHGQRWRGWVRGFSALLLAAITANALGAGLVGIAPGLAADRFAVGLLSVPLLWSGFAIWMVSDRVLSRPLCGMAGTLVASAGMIAWSLLA